MSTVPFCVVNSFTQEAFGGNPAGVVPDAGQLDVTGMQRIAAQLNLIETVFVCAGDGQAVPLHLRYFTPQKELPIAGHPTIAALWALRLQKRLNLQSAVNLKTGAGQVEAWFEAEQVWMRQPHPRYHAVIQPKATIAAALGLDPADISSEQNIEVVDTGLSHMVIELPSSAMLNRATMQLDKFAALCAAANAREAQLFTVSSLDPACQITTRNFCPRPGLEDPACGSGNAALGAWLARAGRLPGGKTIWAFQGANVGKPSKIGIRHMESGAIAIGGNARLMAEGIIHL